MRSRAEATDMVLRFVNTRADNWGRPEVFGTSAGFVGWAAEQDLLTPDAVVTESDAVAARTFRNALVTVLRAHAHDQAVGVAQVDDAETYLLQAGARYPLRSVVTAQGARLIAESKGVPGIFGTVLAAVTEVAQHNDWARIKACCNPPCRLGFIDRTRNRTARFCNRRCGSQVSMRALRHRRKQCSF